MRMNKGNWENVVTENPTIALGDMCPSIFLDKLIS